MREPEEDDLVDAMPAETSGLEAYEVSYAPASASPLHALSGGRETSLAGSLALFPSSFPAIADYAFLSDCENNCLVAPSGAVEWLCLPNPHDPSVFGTLLDRSAGSFRLGPQDLSVPASRRYLPGTTVLETTWQTGTGWLVVTDFLAVGPWHRTDDRSGLHRRTPSDFDARHVLVRIAKCVHGVVDLTLKCAPSFDYGRVDARWEYSGSGYDQVSTSTPGAIRLSLAGSLRLGIEGRNVLARHRLCEGETAFVSLGWSDRPLPLQRGEVAAWRRETEAFWRAWLDRGVIPDHAGREALERSALALKGLTYAPTGALLAAPTTSLPEQPGGERNWDYRFAWVRDTAFAMWGLHALGFDAEAEDFLAFLGDMLASDVAADTTGGAGGGPDRTPCLQILYPVNGGVQDPEVTLDHLSGYDGATPVRVGNGAYGQQQHDIFGALVDCVYQHARNRDALSERTWRVVLLAVEAALACWREPDRGIWEVRGEPRHFTFSKVMCWVAADRGSRLAALHGDAARAQAWRDAAEVIHADVCANGVDDRGRFTQSYGDDELDASLLLLPLVRFLPPDDPRLVATVLGIADELSVEGMVLRYRTEATDDGLNQPEGSFTTCSFWLVSALVEIGEVVRARQLCDRLLAAASPLGLFAEELDPISGRQLGNFPQALTHLALINAVLHVASAEQAAVHATPHLV
ncbi:MAG TPA: glycoside hydrolase family 15 protein [Acidimicrobiales bacterium]|nr:glycoside hydrolase family 15 protein [Acidimicrobiales bacterium]